MSNLIQHLPWLRSINTNSSHFCLYFHILTAIADLVYMCFLNTWKTLFTQAQIAVQTKLSLWLDSQPTSFRVFHFCTRGCHGYPSSKQLRQGETMPSHQDQPGQTTTRQEAEIEPEHLNLEMEATDWTLRGNAHLRRRLNSEHTDWHTVPVFVCLFEANLSVDTQTVITQVVCHVYMLL